MTFAMNTFGKWLEDQRKRARLTQEELGRRVGCTRAYISSLERGVTESKSGRPIQPSKEIVDAIARGLGVPQSLARQYADYYSPVAEGDEMETQLLAYFRSLSPDRKHIAFGIVQLLQYQEQAKRSRLVAPPPDDAPPIGSPVELIPPEKP